MPVSRERVGGGGAKHASTQRRQDEYGSNYREAKGINVPDPYLWHHNEAKGQTEQDHVDAIHPPQEDEVGGNRGAKMT